MGLGAAIGALVTERAWGLPAAGASLRERWAAIAPDLAGHVAAVGYDADSGRLTVCPESAAWATKLRLEQARVSKRRSTRETASDGHRRALAAHQEVAPPRRVDPAIAEAVERQTAAMRALSAQAFPETEAGSTAPGGRPAAAAAGLPGQNT